MTRLKIKEQMQEEWREWFRDFQKQENLRSRLYQYQFQFQALASSQYSSDS